MIRLKRYSGLKPQQNDIAIYSLNGSPAFRGTTVAGEVTCGVKAALDSGFFDTTCKIVGVNPSTRRLAMTDIKWEKAFDAAVGLAGKTHKPIFQDFWFDG